MSQIGLKVNAKCYTLLAEARTTKVLLLPRLSLPYPRVENETRPFENNLADRKNETAIVGWRSQMSLYQPHTQMKNLILEAKKARISTQTHHSMD